MPSLKSNITVFAAQLLPTTPLSPKSCVRFRKMIQVWWDIFRSTPNIRGGGSPLVGHQSLFRRCTHLYSPYVKYKPSTLYLRKQDNYIKYVLTTTQDFIPSERNSLCLKRISYLFGAGRAQSIYWLNLFILKPTNCTNFTKLFWHETVYVSDSSSVHHQ
jgi:hypothetical protein